MNASPDPTAEPGDDLPTPFADVRYSLPTLLHEVKRDRASTTFAMEKLDQAAINQLFQHHLSCRDDDPGH